MVQHRRTTGGGGWYPRIADYWDNQHLQAARKLLGNSKRTTERTILTEIIHLLKLLEIDEIESETSVSVGRLDIFCYRLRTIIETKKVGKAQVDVLSQLEPYIHAKIWEDSNELPFETLEEQNRPWTGIITDGQTWHVWQYPNILSSSPSKHFGPYRPTAPEDLLGFLAHEIFVGKPLGKPRIPQNPYDLFVEDLKALKAIHTGLRGRSKKETKTKFRLWRDMLRASGMEPESESAARDLFVKHSFLVSIARNVAHILTSSEPGKDSRKILGDGFVSWVAQDPDGEDWQEDLLAKIDSYDWRRQKGDVLRSVYERFISEKDRKIFGEHYTPDWLAELLVNETLDPEWCEESIIAANSNKPLKGIGVLDPACGSGTFLYHAARKILKSETMKSLHLPLPRQSEIVVKLVNGIDIHPIAVEISRATLLRALPAPPPDGVKSINVWQGDSLMIFQSKEDESRKLLNIMTHEIREKNLVFQIPGTQSREIRIPLSFCESPNFNFEMDRLISFAMRNTTPKDILEKILETQDKETLEKCCRDFAEIIQDHGNSVWAWYVTNITAPTFLSRRKINRIVANPPWVKLANIQVPYRKRELENTFKAEKLWGGGNLASHNDIAQLFVKICREIYLASSEANPASWIVKKSALQSGQWEKFREWHKPIVSQIIDLEDLEPFGAKGSKSPCAFLEYQTKRQTPELQNLVDEKLVIARKRNRSKKPAHHMSFRDAAEFLSVEKVSVGIEKKESYYNGRAWRQGAIILPHVLVLISQIKSIPQSKNEITITTKASRHPPWKTLPCKTGTIPREWCRSICRADDLYPYMVSPNPTTAIIPVSSEGSLMLNPESHSFWRKINAIYKKHRGNNSPHTLMNLINYQSKLSVQLDILKTGVKTTVIYPKSGKIMRSARTSPGKIIIDDTIYRQNFNSPEEAAYLVSLLNSPCLTEAFAESRKSDRDFHTHIWGCVPIPRFDPKIQDHIQLGKLCEEAEVAVQAWYDSDPEHATYNQIKASRRIRELLKKNGISDRIDAIARRMLPNQAL